MTEILLGKGVKWNKQTNKQYFKILLNNFDKKLKLELRYHDTSISTTFAWIESLKQYAFEYKKM
jgi:hypothetical protein